MRFLTIIIFLTVVISASAQQKVHLINVDSGWAANSVNVAVFRKNSLVTFKDTQFIAYYDKEAQVIIGKRAINDTVWQLQPTSFKGDAADAHRIISIMVDGDGYVHVAWDHHNNMLHYAKSIAPGSLLFTHEQSMTGMHEEKVTYPEFYRLQNGNILFFYRDGGSGNGNLVINKYDLHTNQWQQLQSNLIDGEGQRNAYWQACTDSKGIIHISWVWRESPDVASNHDMCYARSKDGGITWERSNGEQYKLPITQSSAEYITHIPQQSELINQTSMCADEKGNVYIATYWKNKEQVAPQYHLLYSSNGKWNVDDLAFRKTNFSLSGMGTKRIPVSRPQVIAWHQHKKNYVAIIFRDEERGNKVSVAVSNVKKRSKWQVTDLNESSVGSWEPTDDTELWKQQKLLNLFVENVSQADAEGITNTPPQMIQVLQWKP